MSAISTFNQGHAFLIKQSEQCEEERLLDQAIKKTSVMNHWMKRRAGGGKKNWAKGERGKKHTERKGHEWQLIWGVSAIPQRAMTSSGIEEGEERRGSLKSLLLPQAIITFVLNMPKCSCAAERIIFPGWGLEGWINKLRVLWDVFTAKKKKATCFPTLWSIYF